MQYTLVLHREPESYDTSPLGVLAQSLCFFPKLLNLLVPHLNLLSSRQLLANLSSGWAVTPIFPLEFQEISNLRCI